MKELALFVANSANDADEGRASFVLNHAHVAYDGGLREQAVVLYDWLSRNGHGGVKCELRRAQWRLQHNEPKTALRIVDRIEASHRLDAQGVYVKAAALLALDRPAEAVTPLKAMIAAEPHRFEIVRLLFTALEKTRAINELRHADQFLKGLPRERHFEFLLRASIACEDYFGAAKLFSEYPASVTKPTLPRLGYIMQILLGKREFDAIDALFDAAGGVESGYPPVINAKLRALLIRKDLSAAERILLEAEPLFLTSAGSELRLWKLEYFCVSRQLDRAVEYLHECTAAGDLPANWTATVAGLYSARCEWSQVLDFLTDSVRRGFNIASAPTLDALARAARFTGRYREVLQLLDDLLSQAPDEELGNFRDRLLCEICLITGTQSAASPVSDNAIINPLLAERARTLSLALSRSEPEEVERNVYFCTDSNYLAGTSVGLFSFLRNNCALRGKCAITVVCSDDALNFATEIFARISRAFGVSIAVAPASALLGSLGNFRRDWGFYSVRQGLSDAAYYRIFAAQALLARGARGRALYIDSDTWIGHGVARIFAFDLEGQPLGARPDLTIFPEIARAAVALGIEPAKYFNSGVLLFDLEHPELPAALARAVEIAQKQEMLTFHDQCALNLAFRELSTPLPEPFNCFLHGPSPPDPTVEPVILHFAASPKPWDPMYSSAHCMRWVREFAMLADLMTPAMRSRLLASQFPSHISAAAHGT